MVWHEYVNDGVRILVGFDHSFDELILSTHQFQHDPVLQSSMPLLFYFLELVVHDSCLFLPPFFGHYFHFITYIPIRIRFIILFLFYLLPFVFNPILLFFYNLQISMFFSIIF